LAINRLQKLWSTISEKGLDSFLVSQYENHRYLSGFTGSSGWLLISASRTILATDSRYTEQARQETQGFEIIQVSGELGNWLPALVSDMQCHRLGFEATRLSFATHQKLSEAIKAKQSNIELIPTTNLVECLRSIKEAEELEFILKASELTDAAFEHVKAGLHPGITEKEVAWEIESFLRRNGGEGIAFDSIVASGPNSALPHANPTEKAIQPGEAVLIDMGGKFHGYCSDFSRTFYLSNDLKAINPQLLAIYNIVLEAQLTAIDKIESGMTAAQADQIARSVIKQAGYGDAFGHGLGHGVGMAIHELPTLSSASTDLLADGMVFTIEPGIYIAGLGGVRIEDTVILEKGKLKMLTKSAKDSFKL